jgi:hypothetical protein
MNISKQAGGEAQTNRNDQQIWPQMPLNNKSSKSS